MGNCMNRSFPITHVKTAPKKRNTAYDDAPTVESSSTTDQSSSINSPPSSPSKPIHDIQQDTDEHDAEQRSDCSDDLSTGTIEQQREIGQQKIRELVVTGASSGSIDWKSIIALAEELHRKEQRLLASYKTSNARSEFSRGGYNSIGRTNINKRQAFFELRRKRKEVARRKKLESVGSFSVNLLMYGVDECDGYRGESGAYQTLCLDESEEDSSSEVDTAAGSERLMIYEHEEEGSSSSQSEASASEQRKHSDRSLVPVPQAIAPTIMEGSFLAATSMLPPDYDDEDSSSSDTCDSGACSLVSFGGIELEMIDSCDDDDGLITIHEDVSVSFVNQKEWK